MYVCVTGRTTERQKNYVGNNILCTVKPVLRGHDLWDETKWSFKTGDLLKEVQFI